jgi:hypothetical protein
MDLMILVMKGRSPILQALRAAGFSRVRKGLADTDKSDEQDFGCLVLLPSTFGFTPLEIDHDQTFRNL